MIFFSIGLPAPFAEWCDGALLEMARRAFDTIEFIGGNSLEDVAGHLINTGAPHLVVGSRMPNTQLRRLFADSGTRFVLPREDPRVAFAHFELAVGCGTLEALKAVANSCAFILRYSDLPGALVLRAEEVAHEPLTVINAFNEHFGFGLPDDKLQQIADDLQAAGRVPVDPRAEAYWNSLEDEDKQLVAGALDGYRSHFAGGLLGNLLWRRELFLMPGPPVEPLTKVIDVTGRGRCLFFGPYINLPQGFWTARVILACSREAVGIGLTIDVCAGVQLGQTSLQLDRGGIFEVTIRFFIDESNAHLAQVRVFTERSAFDGRVAFGRVLIIPQGSEFSSEDKELATELGPDFG